MVSPQVQKLPELSCRHLGNGLGGKGMLESNSLSGLESNRIKLISFKIPWLCQCTQSSVIKWRESMDSYKHSVGACQSSREMNPQTNEQNLSYLQV